MFGFLCYCIKRPTLFGRPGFHNGKYGRSGIQKFFLLLSLYLVSPPPHPYPLVGPGNGPPADTKGQPVLYHCKQESVFNIKILGQLIFYDVANS